MNSHTGARNLRHEATGIREGAQRAATDIAGCRELVLLVGLEALRGEAVDAILELRETTGAALATEVEAKGMDGRCDERAPCMLGCLGAFGNRETRRYLASRREGVVVVSFGMTLPPRDVASTLRADHAFFVSESAHACATQAMSTASIQGPIRLFADALIGEVLRVRRTGRWVERNPFVRPFEIERNPACGIDGPNGMNPIQVANIVNDLSEEAFIAADPGNAFMVFGAEFEARRNPMAFSFKAGAVGLTAIPSALASALIEPERPSIAVIGDDAWNAGAGAELHTARCYNAGFITIVLDNNGGQICRVGDILQKGEAKFPSAYEAPVDLALDARAKGARPSIARNGAELRAALSEALALRLPQPVVIVAAVDPDFQHENLRVHLASHHGRQLQPGGPDAAGR